MMAAVFMRIATILKSMAVRRIIWAIQNKTIMRFMSIQIQGTATAGVFVLTGAGNVLLAGMNHGFKIAVYSIRKGCPKIWRVTWPIYMYLL